MKKVIFCALACLLALGACTKKNTDEEMALKPSISWVGNDNFATWDIKENNLFSDAKVVLTCPEGFSELTVTATIPTILQGTALKMIGIAENKKDYSNLKFDLIADKTAVNNLVNIKFLQSASITSPCTVDFAAFVDYLRENIELANGDVFSFVINVTDKKENSIKKTATFKWTSGPEITFTPDVTSITVSMDATFDNSLTIHAPGKIKSVLVSFSTVAEAKSDSALLAYLKRVMGDDLSLSLLDESDANVAKRAGFDYDVNMAGKTSGSIKLDNFLDAISLQVDGGGSHTQLLITVMDELGKVLIDGVELLAP